MRKTLAILLLGALAMFGFAVYQEFDYLAMTLTGRLVVAVSLIIFVAVIRDLWKYR